MTPKPRWRTLTLRQQLVIGVSAVVAGVLLVVGVLLILTLRSTVNGIIAAQLSASVDGFSHAVTKYRSTPSNSGSLPPSGTMKPLGQLIGQAPGNVVMLVQNGKAVDSALFTDGEATAAPPEAVEHVAALSWQPEHGPRVVELPGLGEYMMDSRRGDPGEYFVNGVSMHPTHVAVTRQTIIVSAMTAAALLVTALGAFLTVRVALRPLNRVVSTAAEVATLSLDREHHAIAPRVAARDTDPRTEVGMVGETLNRLLDNVEHALADVSASDRRMRQFITDASHELRTPLAAIQGYAELTRQDSAELPETTEYSLARIEAEAQRMNSLVSDLLLLARLDEGQDLATSIVTLDETVLDAVNDAAVSAPSHHWRFHHDGRAVSVVGDKDKLHQLVANLLSNAQVHTPAGTTVEVDVRTIRSDGAPLAQLTVSDDGPGIPPDVLPHLFERFVRADKSRSRQAGSFGLGLAIVSSIVEAHRGTIIATCRDGRTTFLIRLPIAEAFPEPVRAGAEGNGSRSTIPQVASR